MKKIMFSLTLICCSFSTWLPSAHASDASNLRGNINGVLGVKSFNHSDWNSIDNQLVVGVMSDFRKKDWPVSLALDALSASGRHDGGGIKRTLTITELGVGIRKVWDGQFAPFLGVGPLIVSAREEFRQDVPGGTFSTSDGDSTLGLWIDGGLLVRVNQVLQVGACVRVDAGSVEIFDKSRQVGGTSFLLTAGVHF